MTQTAVHAPIHAPLAFAPINSVRMYDAAQTATAVGLSLARFRRVRKPWTRDRDFPAEVNEPGEPIRYLADAVDRWLERRSRRVTAREPEAQLARPRGRHGAPLAAQKGKAALRQIKGGV